MTPAEKEKLDMQARAQQMKINTRLTSLQAAQTIMGTPGYLGVAGEKPPEEGQLLGKPIWIHKPGSVDHLTLIAMATDIEKYILGEIEKETQDALDAMNKPKPTIVPAKEMPASNLRS